MKRILSGIQPTGNLHLGNYLGAIKNWITLQDEGECFFFLVDLHALTSKPDPAELHYNSLAGAAIYMACGIDVSRSTIFIQSQVPAHAELMWILSCYTPLGWLNRMTQFKDKAGKNKEKSNLGLYSYPVLMAADILLYQATDVPVGEDQKQHLEMTRDLAITFNQQKGKDIFTVPSPFIPKVGQRIMSLRDGTAKMSKSDPSDLSRISLFDEPDTIQQKIKKAKTDAEPFPAVPELAEDRPEVKNLIQIFSALSGKTPADICAHYQGAPFAPFKTDLADLCIQYLEPIRREYKRLMEDKGHLLTVLNQGKEKASAVATQTLADVKEAIGLY